MNKLELKHIGRRLHAGVKVKNPVNKIETLTINNISYYLDKKCKPILRPLSDLTKEIEHNRERFVPLDIIYSLWADSYCIRDYKVDEKGFSYIDETGNEYHTNIEILEGILRETVYHDGELIEAFNCDYLKVEKLIEWHFVIDEPEGTWIDVNTLNENPYK